MAPVPSDRISYDDQADVFEARAGLPEPAAVQVADAVRDYAGLSAGDLLVEVGAGTGEIGRWLARSPLRYLGFDRSQPMLDVFAPRLPGAGAVVLCADAERGWPVPDRSAAAVFGSRVLHLLPAAHVTRETSRIARPGGAVLVCGRVEHDPASPRAVARRRLRELLAGHGLQPRATGGRPAQLFAHAAAHGGELLPARVAATWPETVRVSQVIDWWRGKTSIGGVNPPARVADAVLAALTAWAAETYGQQPAPVTTDTRYVLEGVRLPSRRYESHAL